MTCQICGEDDILILTIGRFSWCRDCVHQALIAGESTLLEKYGSPCSKTHGERELEKRRAARSAALRDFNNDKW
jgi:hypothetical protein